MKKLLIILMILLVAACSKPEPQPNEISFNKINKTPIITLHLNGKYARILVDTGASLSLIHLDNKEKYDFKTYKVDEEVSGIGGTANIYNITNLKTTYKDSILKIPFKAADLTSINKAMGIDGIIGSDWLSANKVIIDFKQNKLILNED